MCMMLIIKYIPLQQGLRRTLSALLWRHLWIIKYIPLQQGLRPHKAALVMRIYTIIKYIPLQQGLRQLTQEQPPAFQNY